MEQVELYCQDMCCGEATLRANGERTEICARMCDPGDGLYRAVLEGERGELALGVMEPCSGQLLLRRRPERAEIERVGRVRRVRAVRAFVFGAKQVWNSTQIPLELFRDSFYRNRLEHLSHAWWKRENGDLVLALELREGMPFPLESLFCFARVERVEDTLCAVFVFDEQEMPICRGKL